MKNHARVNISENRFPLDPIIFSSALTLLLIGLVMVASASVEMSARYYGSSFYLLLKHLIYLFISIGIGLLAIGLPIKFWEKMSLPLLIVGMILLVLVLIPGLGREVNGSQRWIPFGPFSIQGSEFLKLFIIFYIAGYLASLKRNEANKLSSFLKPSIILVTVICLLMAQPDFGTSIVITSSIMGIIFLAGFPIRYFAPLLIVSILAGVLLIVFEPYRFERLIVFTNPWEHPYEGGYQLTQALIAFGRGDLFGLGLGNSIQKLFFLPEAHTDFLFSIIAEELGLVGASFIIAIFSLMVMRSLWLGSHALSVGLKFHAYVAYGAGLILGIQAFINLGVNLGVLPTKGLTLPLMSYGGNSLIVSCLLIGILLRVEFECRNRTRRTRAR